MSRMKKFMLGNRLHARSKTALVDEMLEAVDTAGARNALEIGCGAGFVSMHLSKKYGFNVTGTDGDPEMVEYARRKRREGTNLKFLQADSMELPFEDASFGMVVAQNVFHHVPDWRAAAGEVARVLGKNGLFLFSDITGPGVMMRVLAGAGKDHGFHEFDELLSFLTGHGLKVEFEKGPKGAGGKERAIAFRKD